MIDNSIQPIKGLRFMVRTAYSLRSAGLGLILACCTSPALAQDTAYAPRGQQIPPPACMNLHNAWEGNQGGCPPFVHVNWLSDLQHWRTERRFGSPTIHRVTSMPALRWTQSSFIQPQMMVQDRYFYDPVAGAIRSTAM